MRLEILLIVCLASTIGVCNPLTAQEPTPEEHEEQDYFELDEAPEEYEEEELYQEAPPFEEYEEERLENNNAGRDENLSKEFLLDQKLFDRTVAMINDISDEDELNAISSLAAESELSLKVKYYEYFDKKFNTWKEEYIKNQKSLGFTYDQTDEYFAILTPDVDDRTESDIGSDQLVTIEVPIMTETNEKINVLFGQTLDGKSANQVISKLLIDGIKDALTIANYRLSSQGYSPIKSIYIKATTNGEHSTTSNHYKGEAVDISRINSIKLIDTRKSQALNIIFEEELKGIIENGSSISTSELSLGGNNHLLDEVILFQRVVELQRAFQMLNYKRENFGPMLRTKFLKESNQDILFYNIPNHEDHIHFSVR